MISKQAPFGEKVIHFEINEGCKYWVFIIFNKVKIIFSLHTATLDTVYTKLKIVQKKTIAVSAIELACKTV